MSRTEVSKVYRCRKTVCEMLRDRGYLLVEDEVNMSLEQFTTKFGQTPTCVRGGSLNGAFPQEACFAQSR